MDPEADQSHKANLKALEQICPEYSNLIRKFPGILQANFKKVPTSDIFHRIETTGDSFKSKMRPLLADSEKLKMGQKVWEEMIKLGIVERVKPNTVEIYIATSFGKKTRRQQLSCLCRL